MSENPETLEVEMEARAVVAFYKTVLEELPDHNTALAHDLTMAYVASFVRRMG